MAGDTRPFGELFAVPPRNGLTRPKSVRGRGTKMVNMGELFAHPRLRNAEMDRVPLTDSEAERFLLHPGDLLFARQSLVLEGAGKCSIFLGDDDPVTFESHVTRVRLNPHEAEPQFFFYYFASHHGRAAIRSIVEQGAGASGIRGSDLTTLAVHWRPVAEQRAIARILGILDEMIESNRRMGETLQAIARALFKSWFVDFDPVRAKSEGRDTGLPPRLADLFPDGFGNSEVGDVPRGWQVLALAECVDVDRGLSYKGSGLSDSGIPLHNLNSIYEGGGYKREGIKHYEGDFKPQHVARAGDLIVANTEQGHNRRLIGYAAVVPGRVRDESLFSHHLFRVRPSSSSGLTPEYLCHLLNTDVMHETVSGYANGTTVNMLPVDGLRNPLVVEPPSGIVKVFNGIAEAVRQRHETLMDESRTVTGLRDTLLPKLLSGELRLKDTERFAAGVGP